LTRESGRGPICCQQEPYADRTCGASRLQPSRKSYLVLKAALGAYGALIAQRWKFIAIAELNLDSLRFSQEHVLRHLRQITSSTRDCTKRGEAVQDLFRRLDAGLLSLSPHACTCAMGAGVIRDRFLGCNPHGVEHRFSGFTDAVGDAAHMQLPWLCCCCSTTFAIGIMR
jgi:hypothetical protein